MVRQDDGGTAVERLGDCELQITRLFQAPVELVFRAWSEAALFRRWWVPASVTGVELFGCEMDVRSGGHYRLEFRFGGGETMAFHGKYLDVVPNRLIVWTNEEEADGAITSVSFEALGEQTRVRFHERYPSAAALEEALQGSAAGLPEQLAQLAELLASGEG